MLNVPVSELEGLAAGEGLVKLGGIVEEAARTIAHLRRALAEEQQARETAERQLAETRRALADARRTPKPPPPDAAMAALAFGKCPNDGQRVTPEDNWNRCTFCRTSWRVEGGRIVRQDPAPQRGRAIAG